jgi:hypothetical protein
MCFGNGRLFFLGDLTQVSGFNRIVLTRMKKILPAFVAFAVAFVILFVSIFNSSAITYRLSGIPPESASGPKVPEIDYVLPYTGSILPDSPLWGLKALRDKVWFALTSSHLRRAQLALLFADKRLAMSQVLFGRKEPDVAMSTFEKGEKYLPIAVSEEALARGEGADTSTFLSKLAMSALKHMEVAEDLIQLAPEDGKPLIIEMEKYADNTFEAASNTLKLKGLPIPKNPFTRE